MPGIGKRSALRLVLHLLKVPAGDAERLGQAILRLREGVVYCRICKNISDQEIVGLNIPNGVPLVYELDAELVPIRHFYLKNT